MTPSRRLLLREWGLLTLLLVALLAVMDRGGWLERADLWIYDAVIARPGLAPAADPVIVAIDEQSLARVGRWPWSRRLLAQAVDRLTEAGAGPVLLDIILAEPERGDPVADTLLAAALARHGPSGGVVLPVFMPGGQAAPVTPLDIFAAQARLGHAQALVDSDGVARRLLPVEHGDGRSFPHVAWVLLHRTSVADADAAAAPQRVRFRGPPGTFPRVSLAAVLMGEVPAEVLRGRLVLVGATASGLGDSLATPLAGQGGNMAGVEFVANVVDGLRADAMPRALEPLSRLVLSMALVLGQMLLFLTARPRQALIATFGLAGGALLGASFGLHFFGVWWPPAALIFIAALAYPLWNWRRLEASLAAMERETRRIASLAPTSLSAAPRVGFLDPVEGRIEAITQAVDRVAAAVVGDGNTADERRQREEMMRHVAHDLRSPLISLRGLADELKGQLAAGADASALERIDHCARRALDLSEQFILMGRADAYQPGADDEADLVAILHQAADDLWEDARRQGARVERRCELDGAWVRGDARLLHRALLNLGWNALRHGPSQGVVTLSLEAYPEGYRISVHDQGEGFSVAALAALTQTYTQGAQKSAAMGHGLGLALVRKVAEKHGVALAVERPAQGGFAVILDFAAAPAADAR